MSSHIAQLVSVFSQIFEAKDLEMHIRTKITFFFKSMMENFPAILNQIVPVLPLQQQQTIARILQG